MRLLTRLTRGTPERFVAFASLGVCFTVAACGSDKQTTRTTNSLSDASLDAGADARAEATDAALTNTTTRSTLPNVTTREEAGAPETSEPPETSESPATTQAPETTTTATSAPSSNDDSTLDPGTSSDASSGETSEPPLPASCGNGELEGNEMCCRASDIDRALEARFMAGELLLNGDLGCAPPQNNESDSVSYQMCGGPCGTDVGCAVSASNVELTYHPDTKTFTGIADVVIEGSVVLSVAALNQQVSCDAARIVLEEVAFSGDIVTEIGQQETIVDVRGVESELGIPAVSGCAQGNVISAAFLLMQAPIQTAVAEAVEQALEGTIAQPVVCPY